MSHQPQPDSRRAAWHRQAVGDWDDSHREGPPRLQASRQGDEPGRSVLVRLQRALGLALVLGAWAPGCSKPPAEPLPDVVATDVAPEPPPIPPHPTTEQGVVEALTAAMEAQDIEAMKRMLAPELGAELARLHQQNPSEFWANSAVWVKNAKTGMTFAARADDADKVPQWRALLRFGNGTEETVEFTRYDGKLVLAKL